jgi:hypothetical protein
MAHSRTGKADRASTGRPSAFISYSHSDQACLERLRVHLKPLERQGLLDVWDDTMIKAGEQWKQRIELALQRAAIAVLLISPDFMASDFITENELSPLLAAAADRGTIILPLILRPCRFARDPYLARFQAINDPNRPLLKLDDVEQDGVYERLAATIEQKVRR